MLTSVGSTATLALRGQPVRVSQARHSLRRRVVAVIIALTAALVFTAVAYAAYWDFSGNLAQGTGYAENIASGDWARLSRGSACQVKIEGWTGASWDIIYAPNGCADSDYRVQFFTYYAAMCYNINGPTAFINCRIDPVL